MSEGCCYGRSEARGSFFCFCFFWVFHGYWLLLFSFWSVWAGRFLEEREGGAGEGVDGDGDEDEDRSLYLVLRDQERGGADVFLFCLGQRSSSHRGYGIGVSCVEWFTRTVYVRITHSFRDPNPPSETKLLLHNTPVYLPTQRASPPKTDLIPSLLKQKMVPRLPRPHRSEQLTCGI